METQTEQSRTAALRFCQHVDARRFDLCGEMFADDANWLVVANAAWGGPANGKERAQWAGDLLAPFEQWSYKVVNTTAEGNRVVVEGLSRGRGPGVVRYDNTYLMQFTFQGDKIVDFKEAMDCYAVEAWFQSKERQARAEAETAAVGDGAKPD